MFKFFRSTLPDFPPLVLFNSLTRQTETLETLSPRQVKMYSCGPTVYDYAHLGNLRAYVFVDTLKRALLYNGYEVDNTINFTDFGHLTSDADYGDDKMMRGLEREGMEPTLENMRLLADRYIHAFKADLEALNILPPSQFARASDYVREQITLIETLFEKGYAYETTDGVYFEVDKYPNYGRLGNINLENLKAGVRVALNEEKHHPADFALWKKAELGWESRWGKGFPGWHIECSAMALATLGKQIDIHTGGIDHIPIHHNAEIAQSECATGKEFARFWLHNEHLKLGEEKISKSLNNGLILRDLIERGYSADDYRYLLLQTHYRTPATFSFDALTAAKQALTRLKRLVFETWRQEKGILRADRQLELVKAINDDLDTPRVIALLHDYCRDETLTPGERKALLLEADSLLGLGLSDDPEEGLLSLGSIAYNDLPEELRQLIDERQAARAAQNWPEADRLRDLLRTRGYELKDDPEGVQINRTKLN